MRLNSIRIWYTLTSESSISEFCNWNHKPYHKQSNLGFLSSPHCLPCPPPPPNSLPSLCPSQNPQTHLSLSSIGNSHKPQKLAQLLVIPHCMLNVPRHISIIRAVIYFWNRGFQNLGFFFFFLLILGVKVGFFFFFFFWVWFILGFSFHGLDVFGFWFDGFALEMRDIWIEISV